MIRKPPPRGKTTADKVIKAYLGAQPTTGSSLVLGPRIVDPDAADKEKIKDIIRDIKECLEQQQGSEPAEDIIPDAAGEESAEEQERKRQEEQERKRREEQERLLEQQREEQERLLKQHQQEQRWQRGSVLSSKKRGQEDLEHGRVENSASEGWRFDQSAVGPVGVPADTGEREGSRGKRSKASRPGGGKKRKTRKRLGKKTRRRRNKGKTKKRHNRKKRTRRRKR
jgi:hypothetical protein